MKDTFNEKLYPTIGAAFVSKTMETEYGNVCLEMWDTAGKERFRGVAPIYYRYAYIIYLIYDISKFL